MKSFITGVLIVSMWILFFCMIGVGLWMSAELVNKSGECGKLVQQCYDGLIENYYCTPKNMTIFPIINRSTIGVEITNQAIIIDMDTGKVLYNSSS